MFYIQSNLEKMILYTSPNSENPSFYIYKITNL